MPTRRACHPRRTPSLRRPFRPALRWLPASLLAYTRCIAGLSARIDSLHAGAPGALHGLRRRARRCRLSAPFIWLQAAAGRVSTQCCMRREGEAPAGWAGVDTAKGRGQESTGDGDPPLIATTSSSR
jgi:hypothetical protein